MTRPWNRLAQAALLAAALASIALTAGACGDDDDDDTADATAPAGATATNPAATRPAEGAVTIGVADNNFEPANQTVQRGTKVTWTWTGRNPHSVEGKFAGADVKSPQQSSGKFEFTFSQAGTFEYQCGVHGAAMSGKLTVQ